MDGNNLNGNYCLCLQRLSVCVYTPKLLQLKSSEQATKVSHLKSKSSISKPNQRTSSSGWLTPGHGASGKNISGKFCLDLACALRSPVAANEEGDKLPKTGSASS
jgi:hypothetical protein